MASINQFDSRIKTMTSADPDLSTNEHLVKVNPVPSVMKRGKYYNFLPASKNSRLCYTRKFQDQAPQQTNTGFLSSGNNQSYLDFLIPKIPNALFDEVTILLTIQNTNTTTAANLFSGGNIFSQIQVLRGGSTFFITPTTYQNNNIEEQLSFKNPQEHYFKMALEGYASSTLYSGTTIPANSSLVLYCPCHTNISRTLIPFDPIGRGNYSIRVYPQSNVLYAATGNVSLSNLVVTNAICRFNYIEVDSYEYSQLLSNTRLLHAKSLIRRFYSWPVTNVISGSTCNFNLTSTTGTFAQCVIWYSTAAAVNTAVDVYPNIFQSIWLADSGGQNVLGNIP